MEERISFYSGLGYKLTGILCVPDDLSVGEKRGAVLFCHGLGAVKERVLTYARLLAKKGYLMLCFDHRGFGESEGPKWRPIPMEQVEDIRNALTYLQVRREVNDERIGLFGTSLGGANVVYVAAIDRRVKCTVSVVPFGDGERWLRSLRREWEWLDFLKKLDVGRSSRVLTGKSETFGPLDIMLASPDVGREWAEAVKLYPERALMRFPGECVDAIIEYKPEVLVARISPNPIMFVACGNDTVTPIPEQRSLFEKAMEPKKLMTLPDALHFTVYTSPTLDYVAETAIEWYQKYLPPR